MNKKLIFSGVQPTGEIHIGNYLGAISQFVDNQDNYESIYSIVDLHAITVWQDPKIIQSQIHHVLSVFIAAGLNYEKNIIFNQSSVPQHAELAWLLGCTARIGWLNRMTQFKDKAGKNRENASVGLYTYPVLMAADILLYKATHVPVGDDQKQHLELARDIAHKFNVDYEIDFFPLPEPVMNKNTRIMSLRDGTKKMSKSDTSSYSRILMTDNNDDIKTKIKKSKTDSMKMPGIDSALDERPEISNLLNIFSAASGESKEDVIKKFAEREISEFKSDLTDVLINLIEPMSSEIKRLIADKSFLNEVLKKGSDRAKSLSTVTISELHKLMGLKIL